MISVCTIQQNAFGICLFRILFLLPVSAMAFDGLISFAGALVRLIEITQASKDRLTLQLIIHRKSTYEISYHELAKVIA